MELTKKPAETMPIFPLKVGVSVLRGTLGTHGAIAVAVGRCFGV